MRTMPDTKQLKLQSTNGNAVSPLLSGNQNVVSGNSFVFDGPGRFVRSMYSLSAKSYVLLRAFIRRAADRSPCIIRVEVRLFHARSVRVRTRRPDQAGARVLFHLRRKTSYERNTRGEFCCPTVAQSRHCRTGATGLFFDPFSTVVRSPQNSCRLPACLPYFGRRQPYLQSLSISQQPERHL